MTESTSPIPAAAASVTPPPQPPYRSWSTLTPAAIANASALPAGRALTPRGLLVDFGPEGLLFRPSRVRANFPFDPAAVANASALGLYYLNEAQGLWEPVAGGVVSAAGAFSAYLDHFSRYALMEVVNASTIRPAATTLTATATSAAADGGGNASSSSSSPVGARTMRSKEWGGFHAMWREGAAAAGLLSVLFVAAVCGVPALALCLGAAERDAAPTTPPKIIMVAASATLGGQRGGGEPFANGNLLMFNSTRPPPAQNPAASAGSSATYNHTPLPRAEPARMPPYGDRAEAAPPTIPP